MYADRQLLHPIGSSVSITQASPNAYCWLWAWQLRLRWYVPRQYPSDRLISFSLEWWWWSSTAGGRRPGLTVAVALPRSTGRETAQPWRGHPSSARGSWPRRRNLRSAGRSAGDAAFRPTTIRGRRPSARGLSGNACWNGGRWRSWPPSWWRPARCWCDWSRTGSRRRGAPRWAGSSTTAAWQAPETDRRWRQWRPQWEQEWRCCHDKLGAFFLCFFVFFSCSCSCSCFFLFFFVLLCFCFCFCFLFCSCSCSCSCSCFCFCSCFSCSCSCFSSSFSSSFFSFSSCSCSCSCSSSFASFSLSCCSSSSSYHHHHHHHHIILLFFVSLILLTHVLLLVTLWSCCWRALCICRRFWWTSFSAAIRRTFSTVNVASGTTSINTVYSTLP